MAQHGSKILTELKPLNRGSNLKTEISPEKKDSPPDNWKAIYFIFAIISAIVWFVVYAGVEPFTNWLLFSVAGLDNASRIGESLSFFIYDTIRILLLLIALIYVIALARAAFNLEKARDYLAGKNRFIGYFLGAFFGSVTPFCSCSSIPLFLGFATAGIPIGITMAFLITSPLINEIAVVLLWGLLGWKFTIIYIVCGLLAGIIGGYVMDWLKAERWLQPSILQTMRLKPILTGQKNDSSACGMYFRHNFALNETRSIFRQVWKWVVIGVAIGAALHGYVPDQWFAENLGAGEWWTVPAAVCAGIPLYTNVTGIVPVMESLLVKGLPIGTTLAFCMSAVAASIPEVMLLRKIMTFKLQFLFIGCLWVIFTLMGWLFNVIGPALF